MILVATSGRKPTMRHLGGVHRASLQWMQERLGKHSDRDQTILFYESTDNMSADIYTKAFTNREKWTHALKLINVFDKGLADDPNAMQGWIETRAALGNEVDYIDTSRRFIWSKSGARRRLHEERKSARPVQSTLTTQRVSETQVNLC